MAAKSQHAGRFQAGGATAHHHGPPGRGGSLDSGIEPGLAPRGDVVLTQCVPATVDPVETVSGTDAGADALRLAFRQLVDDVRIRHVRAGHAGHVDMAFRDGPVGSRRIRESCRLQCHETTRLAHPACQFDVGGNRPGHSRHGFCQAHLRPAIGSVDVDDVGDTVAADHAGGLDPFLGREPVLVALVGIHSDADENVIARRRAAGLENLEEEARPAVKVATVVILAIVGERRQELAHQVGRRQDLDAVEPAFPATPRCFAKVPDNARDFMCRKGIGYGMVGRIAKRRRPPGRQPVTGIPGGATAHVGDLAH